MKPTTQKLNFIVAILILILASSLMRTAINETTTESNEILSYTFRCAKFLLGALVAYLGGTRLAKTLNYEDKDNA
jgi:hypothetical protein